MSVAPGSFRTVGVNQTITLTGLVPGLYSLQLQGLAANCALQHDSPVAVTVVAGLTVEVTFEITCVPTTGSVRVTTTTTGIDPDRDGYLVTVDGAGPVGRPRQLPVSSGGAVLIPDVAVGRVVLTLAGVLPNCDEPDGFRRADNVSSGDTLAVAFNVLCSPVTRIAYVKPAGGGTADIAIINSNGTGERLLTTHPARDGDPAWSPDHGRLAFATNRDGNREIYLMDADGSNAIRLTDDAGRDDSPAWSPDGNRIAFVRDRAPAAGQGSIRVMNADGTDPEPVTLPGMGVRDADPVWSPDGRSIAFTRYDGGGREIHRVNADGSGVTRLSNPNDREGYPTWSADGTKLAFVRYICVYGSYGCHDALIVRVSTGTFETLLPVAGTEPAWSADGRHIAYTSFACNFYFEECKPEGIHVIRADGISDFTLRIPGTAPAW